MDESGAAQAKTVALTKTERKSLMYRDFKRSTRLHWELYLLLLLPVALTIIFQYVPMYGLQIAFKDFRPARGIWGSEWVGMRHFVRFVQTPSFIRVIGNTLRISLLAMIIGFPFPIILAVMLNEARVHWFKRTVQMATFAPYFISIVVVSGIVIQILDMRVGLVNHALAAMGLPRQNFMARPTTFDPAFIISSIWQGTGFSSVIYLAALTAISPELHEAATADGASRLRRLWHIDLPGIVPTITIILILNFGSIMGVSLERAMTLQNDINRSVGDVIGTFVFRVGIQQRNFSFTAAIGFANSIVNLIMIVTVNQIARKIGETSLW